MPFLVNSWRSVHEVSPFRITYGTRNPALHGLILTSDSVVPNFSWTPRLVLDDKAWNLMMERPSPGDLLLLPAIHTTVMRVFQHGGNWYISDSNRIEMLGAPEDAQSLSTMFQLGLGYHFKQGWRHFVREIRRDRVWFFGVDTRKDSSNFLFLGTCAMVPHSALPVDPRQECPDLDFTVHRFLPPSIPILPELHEVEALWSRGVPLHDAQTLSYTQRFDGFLIVNPVTLFAARLCDPEVAFLTPLLQEQQSMPQFLATHVVRTQLTDASRVHMDRPSYRWWKETVEEMIQRLLAERYGRVWGSGRAPHTRR